MATLLAAPLCWFTGLAGALRNACRFTCLCDRSDRELAARGLTRKRLVASYLGSFGD